MVVRITGKTYCRINEKLLFHWRQFARSARLVRFCYGGISYLCGRIENKHASAQKRNPRLLNSTQSRKNTIRRKIIDDDWRKSMRKQRTAFLSLFFFLLVDHHALGRPANYFTRFICQWSMRYYNFIPRLYHVRDAFSFPLTIPRVSKTFMSITYILPDIPKKNVNILTQPSQSSNLRTPSVDTCISYILFFLGYYIGYITQSNNLLSTVVSATIVEPPYSKLLAIHLW